MENTLFKEYEEWCVKNKKDPLNEDSMREFKAMKLEESRKKERTAEDEKKAAEQKKIFDAICKYADVEAEYDADYMLEGFDAMLKAIVMAVVIHNSSEHCDEVLDKLFN